MSLENMVTIDALNVSKIDREFLLRLKKGGVTVIHTTLVIWENARETLSQVGKLYKVINENSDIAMIIASGSEFEEVNNSEKVGIILGAQNTSHLEDELSLVEVFNNLGIKIMQLTYNNQNLIATGKYENNDSGLTRFGRNVIDEMNRLGVLVDLSHVGDQSSIEAIEYSNRSVAITHANPHWIYPRLRNKPKKVLESLRDNDGMLGLTLFPNMMNGKDTSIEEFTDFVKETVDFMGSDKVGFGTDLIINRDDEFMFWARMGRWTHEIDYGSGNKNTPTRPTWPDWFQGPEDFSYITESLLRSGMPEGDVRGVMGENWKRFLTDSFKKSSQ